jgi:cytochrome b
MAGSASPPGGLQEIRLWDPVVRICHWVLTVSFLGAWALGEFGPNVMTWHFILGYVALGAIVVRLCWAVVGPPSARFASYFYGPSAILGYLRHMFRRQPSYWPGHNPVAGPIILGLLFVALAVCVTGLFVDPDDYVNVGPLAGWVDAATRRAANSWHRLLADVAMVLVVLHVSAITFYRVWKHENVVLPMITGRKLVRKDLLSRAR